MKRYMLILVFATISITVLGQKERKFIRKGNDLYRQGIENSDSTAIDSLSFANAEVEYRKALDKKPNDLKAQFNIGNAQFKQQKMAEAATQFEQTLELSVNKEDKAKVWFNYGNAMLAQQKLDESIEAYKNALRNNPSDLEAKYNLEFARRMKQQQEQQQQNQDQNKDQNQEQNKDQNKDQQDQNKDQQDQNKDQQDQNQDQNKDQQDQQQQQNQQQPKISKQSAEQMLKALQNDEKETQEKVKKAEAAKAKTNQPEIDW
ncbi:tetratricopeptide repeat protein [Roseimarinus sediminis]|uniref:tetratricopeptide repeat protein n=1 Tax=Roseimarinus sediminis TaxID=1610899 RepID=UPI003D206714